MNVNNKVSFGSIQGSGSTLSRKLMKIVPPINIKGRRFADFLTYVNDKVSSPEQRLLMGITALFSQPIIDINNKRVNEETRLMSFSRTLAKIIVGTTVGVLVRRQCIKLANKLTKITKECSSIDTTKFTATPIRKTILFPDKVENCTDDKYRTYINSLGTVLGIGVSLVTNFLIDAPLTQLLTNFFYKNIKNGGAKNDS